MDVRTITRICSTVLTLALLPAPVRAQTLGEIARKEAERRKTAGEAKAPPAAKVYTNGDLKPAPAPASAAPAPAPAAAAAPAADAKGQSAQAQKPPEEEKGESYWRGRMAQAREELRRNQLFRDALQTRINSLSSDYAARDLPDQRAQIGRDRQTAVDEMARVTAEIEQNTKQIDAIENEARLAGVPPGWLR